MPQSFFIIGRFSTDARNQDIERWDKVDIDTVRRIKERASLKRSDAEGKIFVLNADNMTREAGAALLKLLEEPPAGTCFILEAASRDSLSTTLLSRLTELESISRVTDGKSVYGEVEGVLRPPNSDPTAYFAKIEKAAKLRKLSSRPATPAVFIKDFAEILLK